MGRGCDGERGRDAGPAVMGERRRSDGVNGREEPAVMGKPRGKRKKNLAASIMSAISIVILLLVVAACLPLTLPRFFGYHIYTVVSGSMEPAIPTGSLVYIKDGKPEEAVEGEVIAFYGAVDSASIITHRVVENRVVMGEIVTKGDANQSPDMNPVPYARFIGKVELTVPEAGKIAAVFASPGGKGLAGCSVGMALLLQAVASLIEGRRGRKEP